MNSLLADPRRAKGAPNIFKNFFKGWNAFEYIMFFIGLTVPLTLGIVFRSHPLFIVAGTCFSLTSLFLAKGKIEGYFMALVSAALYAAVAWMLKLYGEVAIQFFIMYPMAIAGIISWAKNRRVSRTDGVVVVVGHVGLIELFCLVFVAAGMAAPLYFLLRILKTDYLILSVASLCLTIIFGYLLIRRSRKAMWFNVLSDIPTLVIWILMVVGGVQSAIPLLAMETIFIVQDIFGIFEWRELKRRQRKSKRQHKTNDIDNGKDDVIL